MNKTTLDDLAKSGLTPETIDVEDLEGRERHRDAYHSYRIFYLDPSGSRTGMYTDRNFFTAAHMAREKERKKKPPKYLFSKGLRGLYLSRGVDWTSILADVNRPICITEGEKKAAAACAVGITTIGLAGIFNTRSKKSQEHFDPALDAIAWNGRQVRVVLDSDAAANDAVRQAGEWLCSQLKKRGAVAVVRILTPLPDGAKAGLDDAIVHRGAEATLHELASPIAPHPELEAINERVIQLETSEEYIDLLTGSIHSFDKMKRLVADRGKLKDWIEWPLRNRVRRMTFEPAQPSGVIHVDGENLYNDRGDWAVDPTEFPESEVKSQLAPWWDLLAHVFPDSPETQEYVNWWIGMRVKHIDRRADTALVLWSVTGGTGKSSIFHTLSYILGDFYKLTGAKTACGRFSDWKLKRTFVFIDELTEQEKNTATEHFKSLITDPTTEVEIKNVAAYTIPNRISYGFASNYINGILVPRGERRFVVFHATEEARSRTWWDEVYEPWLKGGGAAMLRHYWTNYLDTAQFPWIAIPDCALKDTNAAKDVSASHLDEFVLGVKHNPDEVLGDDYDLYTSEELWAAWLSSLGGTSSMVKPQGLARRLSHEPAPLPRSSGRNIFIGGQRKDLWMVRSKHHSIAEYRAMNRTELADAYYAERPTMQKPIAANEKFKPGLRPN